MLQPRKVAGSSNPEMHPLNKARHSCNPRNRNTLVLPAVLIGLFSAFTLNINAGSDQAAVAKPEPARAGALPPCSGQQWENSLGMKFLPVAGASCLFAIWETRVQDFESFVKASGYDATAGMYSATNGTWEQKGDTWKSPGFEQGPTHPVCAVSWDDAKAFCKWLTEKERAEGRLPAGWEYRLPTDEEWSAAVGLKNETGDTPDKKNKNIEDVYPWGTQWPPPRRAGNYDSRLNVDSYDRTSPAGSLDANRSGLYDMGGNLWEWCEDYFNGKNGCRVMRGASWDDIKSDNMLSSCRSGCSSADRVDLNGFRCVVAQSAR